MTNDILPEIRWTYTQPLVYSQHLTTITFREWHRARLLGLELAELEIGTTIKTTEEIRRVNQWIEANGAWRASALPYYQGRGLLYDVIGGETGINFKIGTAGAGRSSPLKVVPLHWYKPDQRQSHLML